MAEPQRQTLVPEPCFNLNSTTRRETPQRVFVYGTLKKGFGAHKHYLEGCKELGVAEISGIMFHLGGCPAINLAEPFSEIHGEVYEVKWDDILNMDGLEGVAHGFYSRIETRVKPHGTIWTYVFTSQRASKETWVIPSGIWRGPDTPKVPWKGFSHGVSVGAFETDLDVIKIKDGNGHWELKRSPMDSTYKLIDKRTQEVLGSYRHLRDMTGSDGNRKPVLRLPPSIRKAPEPPLVPPTTAVEEAVKGNIYGPVVGPRRPIDQHPGLPIIWTPEGAAKAEEAKIPQAARFLGIKYGEA
jgi:gamma-glutamylcyclotransferase (GGCT)/AIG2-like uncharacterized protein YtfP